MPINYMAPARLRTMDPRGQQPDPVLDPPFARGVVLGGIHVDHRDAGYFARGDTDQLT